MFKLAFVGTIAAFAFAQQHPINDDLVEEIKQKTNSWVPHSADENPLKDKSMSELMGLFGTVL